ncbi:MAG: SpoIIE family protein phosphatase [Bacteroidia bacterium]|nr:SpoIIE family protein phosphatase [Bacteroidia bacterium]
MRIFFILLLLLPAVLRPEKVVTLRPGDPIREIGSNLEYFRDSTASLNFETVCRLKSEGRFLQSPSNVLNFNLTSDVIWLHGWFTADGVGPWYLESNNPSITRLTYYIRVNHGEWRFDTLGLTVPLNRRELHLYRLIHPIDIMPGDTAEVFISAFDYAPLLIQIRAGTLDRFFENDHQGNRLHGVYFGLIIMMILYNAFLYVTNRESVYLYYVGYMVFNALFVSIVNGYLILLPEWMDVVLISQSTIIPALFSVFGVLFTITFLNLAKYAPVWRKIMIALLVLPATAFLFTLLGFGRTGFSLLQLGGMLFAVCTLVVGIVVYLRGYRPAKFYLLGFGSYFIGLFFLIMVDVIHLPYHDEAIVVLEIGGAMEAIMLSFAIGDKLNISTKEKQLAQAEALRAATENERIIREQNVVLENKVNERTKEIALQKDIIEDKNKDILGSIQYARRIQKALIASDIKMQKILGDHFIFYRPKDIVSGDFYWAEETPAGDSLLCVGDCTGHGVPGAFMSLLNITFLNEALTRHPDGDPAAMLNYVRKQVIRSLAADAEGGKDGMDAVMIRLNRKSGELSAACANNPMWIVRKNEVLELPPDKMPVGKHHMVESEFRNKFFRLEKNDLLILFTDGYADQFGGEKYGKAGGKKFKYKNLMALLQTHSGLTGDVLVKLLDDTLAEWKGNLEQVDDILLIGIRY